MICAHCKEFRSAKSAEILEHAKACAIKPWEAVVEAKANGTFTKAKRLRRDILGIETKPMPEGLKEHYQRVSESGLGGQSEVKKRIKALEKKELKALMKPTNNPGRRKAVGK